MEGLQAVSWSTLKKLLRIAKKLHADVTVTGRNVADYAAELGDPLFLRHIQYELGVELKAYTKDSIISQGLREGKRGLLLTVPVKRLNWSGAKSMGREANLSEFAEYLKINQTLQELVMWECSLESKAASVLFSSLCVNESVNRVDVMRNPGAGTAEALTSLSTALSSNQSIQELVLWSCDVDADGTAVLCKGLAVNKSVKKLNLRENRGVGSPQAMQALGAMLAENTGLEELDLWECGINAEAIMELYKGLAKNRTLKRLALVGNRGVGHAAALEALGACLAENSVLKEVFLSGCGYRAGYIDDAVAWRIIT